ncbi:aconitase X swivel domain-containing protein [Simiduia agarivorans]|uniref:Phosphomevalonate dehydratase small subunit-like domain-containing protein n=1 Tax=Simiduia agarivorans (strain DSM 21679 / JCM 13881 / BCRC 17597 / SA1) TaxID=1117647 RepID=K4L299_SIMAS|nr:DUF126 domain-containing protein [Simiduia agarivorans]AFV00308.1 hypothetical protein M5M_15875 [Simiduia agarivorans SA1 = DSM 21679]
MNNLIQGRVILAGNAKGPALVTDQPINFTAAHCKPANLLPGKKSRMHDRHHPLYRAESRGKILVFPSCIGSTHTGLVLLDLVSQGIGPAGLIVGEADSLLVSGVTLSAVWFERSIPIIALPEGLSQANFTTGQTITIDTQGLLTLS